nr:unnamed protein product [Callosobruchus analis]
MYLGKNGYVWKTAPINNAGGKTPAKNIVYIRPGPTDPAKNVIEPADIFSIFFTEEILSEILVHTNEKIAKLQEKYRVKTATVAELRALLGIIFLSAALKNDHLLAKLLFDTSYSGERYRTTMSRERFNFLINSLRFDDQETREERKKCNNFAPISNIWDIFIGNCMNNYKPNAYVTIDELVGFRGKCPFRIYEYMPNKPNKYGIKIVMLCDVATSIL